MVTALPRIHILSPLEQSCFCFRVPVVLTHQARHLQGTTEASHPTGTHSHDRLEEGSAGLQEGLRGQGPRKVEILKQRQEAEGLSVSLGVVSVYGLAVCSSWARGPPSSQDLTSWLLVENLPNQIYTESNHSTVWSY